MSTVISYEDVLEKAAIDGSIEPPDWSRFFETILARLEQNVHKEFPIPSIPESPTPSTYREHQATPPNTQGSDLPGSDLHQSQTINNENTPPSCPPSAATRPVMASPQPPNAVNPSDQNPENSLPDPLLATWTYVRQTLTQQFYSSPPHTIQRLSELILWPHRHYRFLPAYLNALDRVVSVSSGSNRFPLPAVELGSGSGAIVNGTALAMTANIKARSPSSASSPPGLDSDESFGGALLTPIPWLRRNGSMSGQPSPERQANGDGDSLEHMGDGDTPMEAAEGVVMRDHGAVTQGELMRQEQEASDPPAAVASMENRQHIVAMHSGADQTATEGGQVFSGEDHEQPHARGPEHIGMEDTGPQEQHAFPQVLDMEAAVGRGPPPTAHSVIIGDLGIEVDTPNIASAGTRENDMNKDNDGDVEITDVDGLTENETLGGNAAP